MSYNPLKTPVDFVLINGMKTPGIARIEGGAERARIQQSPCPGVLGSFVRFVGRELAEFDIVLTFWLPEHWDAWRAFEPIVHVPAFGVFPRIVPTVSHPELAQIRVTAMMIKEYVKPEVSDDGKGIVVLKCLEYRKPIKGFVAPASPDTPKNEPKDAGELRIEALRTENDALDAQLKNGGPWTK